MLACPALSAAEDAPQTVRTDNTPAVVQQPPAPQEQAVAPSEQAAPSEQVAPGEQTATPAEAPAQVEEKQRAAPPVQTETVRSKTAIALSVGAFFPSSSATRRRFSSSWTRATLSTFDPIKPTRWRFTAEGSSYRYDGPTDLRAYSMSFGIIKGLSQSPDLQPYLTFRAGPYYARVKEHDGDLNSSHMGLHANTALGLVIKRKLYVEARYDVFSRFAGIKLDGFSLTAGIKLCDLKL